MWSSSVDLDDDSDDGGKREKSSTKFTPESELAVPSSSSGFTENVRHAIRVFSETNFEI